MLPSTEPDVRKTWQDQPRDWLVDCSKQEIYHNNGWLAVISVIFLLKGWLTKHVKIVSKEKCGVKAMQGKLGGLVVKSFSKRELTIAPNNLPMKFLPHPSHGWMRPLHGFQPPAWSLFPAKFSYSIYTLFGGWNPWAYKATPIRENHVKWQMKITKKSAPIRGESNSLTKHCGVWAACGSTVGDGGNNEQTRIIKDIFDLQY